MDENVTMLTLLQELREFRKETNERFDFMDKRITKLEEKVDKLDERVSGLEYKVNEISDKVTKLDERASNLEEGRKSDRREILDVLDTMQKSISKQFIDLKDYMDIQIEKFNLAGAVNDIEHAQFRQLLKAYGVKIDIQDCRVKYLEKWKEDFGESDFVAAF